MFKKLFSTILIAFVFYLTASAQKKFNVYGIGFYNLENLFDTCHDAGKNDYEFLPSGSYKWNGMKYSHKLHNMARALSDMGTRMLPGVGCAVVGVSEIENDNVLAGLCSQPALAARGYKFCHVEGPDLRGVDCGLLYQPSLFKVAGVWLDGYSDHLPTVVYLVKEQGTKAGKLGDLSLPAYTEAEKAFMEQCSQELEELKAKEKEK